MSFIAIGLLGALGVYLRFGLEYSFGKGPFTLPYYTLLANLTGCLIAGLLINLFKDNQWSKFMLIGFCGGLTTFSSYSLQLFYMLENGHFLKALTYLFISTIGGLFCVYIGYKMTA